MEPLEPISILLVDDRPEKLLSLEAILSDLPLKLVRAASGGDALRCLLQGNFALILLDIDMPTMDGFETAKLIRQRRSSRDTPIIFVTAYQDELFMARGYSLGAVDYILQPVVPDVLRSKVSVFVDLYRKNQLVLQQAQWQEQRASQLQKLAAASVAINAAPSMERTLQVITESARDVVGSHQAITLFVVDKIAASQRHAEVFTSFSDKYAEWRHRTLNLDQCTVTAVAQSRTPTRLTEADLRNHPDWAIVKDLELPPLRGMVAVPLHDRQNQHIGLVYLADKINGEFTADDEAILIQLAQMAAVAIENILNAEAREANRAKDQFIAVLSHELRTPLTPVLLTLSAIERDPRLPKDLRDHLQLVSRNVELEARIIDDLLDLTRISKGKVELRLAAVDLYELLQHTLSICKQELVEQNLNVSLNLAAEHHFINGDATRLQQVFWNLVKNAIKFTPSGGAIVISSSNPDPATIQVSVNDTGIGIDPGVLKRLFNAFEQGNSSITRQFGGLGLGLAISKAIVDRHHGTLAATSLGSGQGSTFTLTLPTTREVPVKAVEEVPPVSDADAPLLASHRILLVEDHRDTARVMSRMLRSLSFKVDCASTVAQALSLIDASEYDLLISDIGLPDGSGHDLIRRIHKRQPLSGIAMSGFGMEDDIRRSKDAGFRVHLTKPIDFKVLLERIKEITAEQSRPVAAQ